MRAYRDNFGLLIDEAATLLGISKTYLVKIENGEKTVGMYVQLADSSISKIVGLAGYDFIWVDNEHSYIRMKRCLTILWHCGLSVRKSWCVCRRTT